MKYIILIDTDMPAVDARPILAEACRQMAEQFDYPGTFTTEIEAARWGGAFHTILAGVSHFHLTPQEPSS